MKIINIVLSILTISFFLGCVAKQPIQQTRTIYEEPPFIIEIPVREILQASDVPVDVQMVTGAIILNMRKDPRVIPGVSFNPSGWHSISEKEFSYTGFGVKNIDILNHWTRNLKQDVFLCRIEGVIHFADALGRTALVNYSSEYELSPDSIDIKWSLVRPVPPIFPNTQAFIVEAAEFQTIVNLNPDFNRFYTEIVAGSVNMTTTPEERKIRHEKEERRSDYYMIIFVMDRIMPDADIEVVVTGSRHDKKSLAESIYRDFDGWRVAIFGGNFAIDHDVFYAQTYYKPAPGVLPDNLEKVLIGLFATERNYEEKPMPALQQTEPSALEPAADTSDEGSLISDRHMLDTSNRNDAAKIQTSLAELGFYTMAVDGLWGAGSRQALQSFQSAYNLTANGDWNMQTQMKLILLDTSNPDDALIIQAKLAELGFYNMAIDGKWGAGSRKALESFQESQDLNPKGIWSMETQLNMF